MSVNHSKSLLYTSLQHCFSVFLILSSAYSGEYPHSCALVVSVRVHFTPKKTKYSTLFNQLDKILRMCFHGNCSHLLSVILHIQQLTFVFLSLEFYLWLPAFYHCIDYRHIFFFCKEIMDSSGFFLNIKI